jgi:hypothetical protein
MITDNADNLSDEDLINSEDQEAEIGVDVQFGAEKYRDHFSNLPQN